MKVLVFADEYEPNILGGLGVVATQLSKAMHRDHAEITLVTACPGYQVIKEKKRSIQIFRFPLGSSVYHSHTRHKFKHDPIIEWLDKHGLEKQDVIHIHSVPFTPIATHYQKEFGVPLVYTCHSLVMHEGKSRLQQIVAGRQEKLLQKADCVVVPSKWQETIVRQVYPFCHGKIEVINNGVEVRNEGASALGHHLLFVGRLTPLKGIEELLQAAAILVKEKHRVRLDVVGTGSHLYTNKLKMLTGKLGIRNHVRWLGKFTPDQVQKLYASYGAVIMPSRRESFGLVALEALANSVPLVSTVSGGLSEFISSDVAEIIPRVTGVDIAKAIRYMWNDRSRTKHRVEKGFKIASNYEWSAVASSYQHLFRNLRKKGES